MITAENMWKEFLELIKENKITAEHILPNHELLREQILSFLKNRGAELRAGAEAEVDGIFRVNEKIHILAKINNVDYCLSFIAAGDKWYFNHMECLYIRLDGVAAPTDSFPDISERQKNWMRQEVEISNKVRIYNTLKAEKNRDFAIEWLKDGNGYFMSAYTWVPFVSPKRAFILYLCWEQANLIGNGVTLKLLEEDRAEIILKPIYLELYQSAGHLKLQISYEEYMGIFEAAWKDRAEKAGWKLDIEYEKDTCFFSFTI